MVYRELHFNNKSSFSSFGLYIESFNITPPTPVIIEETIPYRSGSYDFSRINNKNRIFSNRNITIVLFWKSKNNDCLFETYSEIQMWLLNCFYSDIRLDGILGNYRGKVKSISNIALLRTTGKLTITFECESYKYNNYCDYIWDDFNFNTDISLINKFSISKNTNITINNKGIATVPTISINSNAPVTLILKNKKYELNQGDNFNNDILLENGRNDILLLCDSDGDIEFNFIEKKF